MATMIGHWPFKKNNAGASSSSAAKNNVLPCNKKDRNRPYMSMEIAHALYDQNASLSQRDIHLPCG
jgi:hypothetical protein